MNEQQNFLQVQTHLFTLITNQRETYTQSHKHKYLKRIFDEPISVNLIAKHRFISARNERQKCTHFLKAFITLK